jgi:hypothetical protein
VRIASAGKASCGPRSASARRGQQRCRARAGDRRSPFASDVRNPPIRNLLDGMRALALERTAPPAPTRTGGGGRARRGPAAAPPERARRGSAPGAHAAAGSARRCARRARWGRTGGARCRRASAASGGRAGG